MPNIQSNLGIKLTLLKNYLFLYLTSNYFTLTFTVREFSPFPFFKFLGKSCAIKNQNTTHVLHQPYSRSPKIPPLSPFQPPMSPTVSLHLQLGPQSKRLSVSLRKTSLLPLPSALASSGPRTPPMTNGFCP